MKLNISKQSEFTTEQIRNIILFVRPSGIANFDIEIKSSSHSFGGATYPQGCGYHRSSAPLVVCRVAPNCKFPELATSRNAGKNTKQIPIGTSEQAMVFLMAHELRHLWQHKQKNRRGYFPKTRGKYSEIDADAYALNKLRAWNKK